MGQKKINSKSCGLHISKAEINKILDVNPKCKDEI